MEDRDNITTENLTESDKNAVTVLREMLRKERVRNAEMTQAVSDAQEARLAAEIRAASTKSDMQFQAYLDQRDEERRRERMAAADAAAMERAQAREDWKAIKAMGWIFMLCLLLDAIAMAATVLGGELPRVIHTVLNVCTFLSGYGMGVSMTELTRRFSK